MQIVMRNSFYTDSVKYECIHSKKCTINIDDTDETGEDEDEHHDSHHSHHSHHHHEE